ncbi:MAG: hypothetical protein FWE27_08255 [Defluviitaleaceae bacterium]|nr:hypothetical protein [Defluviitaleaceae bacterium]
MKGITYDVNKLSESGKFDTSVSKLFFYSTQEYFNALTDFVQNYKQDLANYTPAFVIHSEDSRKEFINECFAVRASLVRLGMPELLDALDTLENAAISKHEKEFSDGQIKFRATIKIYKEKIKEAEKKK